MPNPFCREGLPDGAFLGLGPRRIIGNERFDGPESVDEEVEFEISSTLGKLLKWFSTGVEIADKEEIRCERTSGDLGCGGSSSPIFSGSFSFDNIIGEGRRRSAGRKDVFGMLGTGGIGEAM